MADENDLVRRVERLEAIAEIGNVMSRRAYLHSAGLHEREIDECWSIEHDDIEFEPVQFGARAGRETVLGVLTGLATPVGHMYEHTLSTPLIEVAADGQAPAGLWISPGHETYIPLTGYASEYRPDCQNLLQPLPAEPYGAWAA